MILQFKILTLICAEQEEAETHSACSAQRQVVHLLGERSHDTGGVKRQTGLYGRRWGDHSTLREEGKTRA